MGRGGSQKRGSLWSLNLMWKKKKKKGIQVTAEEYTDSPMGPVMDAKFSANHRECR